MFSSFNEVLNEQKKRKTGVVGFAKGAGEEIRNNGVYVNDSVSIDWYKRRTGGREFVFRVRWFVFDNNSKNANGTSGHDQLFPFTEQGLQDAIAFAEQIAATPFAER